MLKNKTDIFLILFTVIAAVIFIGHIQIANAQTVTYRHPIVAFKPMMLKLVLFLIWLAFVHAKWEIQIEGKDGWARELPCWRLNVFFRKLLGGKALTGYHTWMMLLVLSIFHGIFIFLKWNIAIELLTIGFFLWYFVIEDFLWFIFNRHYRLRRFLKKEIPWHKRWIGPLPLTYWIATLVGSALIYLGLKLL